VRLRQSYLRLAPRSRREAARLIGGRGQARAEAHLGKLRCWLGRLIRDLERKLAGDPERAAACAWVLERARRLHAQAPGDTDKLYAFHAPEVACLGKGKARTRYEFGVKTSVATTNARARGGQFVLGALTCPGNPYDARTLAPQLDQVARVTGIAPPAPTSTAATAATRSAAPDSRSMSPTPAASSRRPSAASSAAAAPSSRSSVT
jgi:IS5 family transposase